MLGFCRDPFVTQLYNLGYTLVPLPEAEIAPLDVFGRQRRELFRLGKLGDMFDAGDKPLPPVATNIEAAELQIKQSSSLDSGLGAAIVNDWLGKHQAEVAGKIQNSGKFSFQLKDVVKDRVDLDPLDKFLNAAEMKSGGPFLRRLMESDDIFVVTSVLKARSVLMSSTEKDSAKAKVTLPAGGLPVGGKGSLELVIAENTSQEFKAAHPLAFAVQAVQVCFLEGRYNALYVARSQLKPMSADGRAQANQSETGWLSDALGPYFPRFSDAS